MTNYEKHFSVKAELEKEISDEMKKDALLIDRGVVLATPVDTGRARANWIVSLGDPVTTTTEEQGESVSFAQGQAEILKQKGFQRIIIQNNLPYIKKLNDGHSKQAPKKFIERVIEQVKNA